MNSPNTEISLVFADGLGFHYTDNEIVRKSFEEVFSATIPLPSILGYSLAIHPTIWTSNYPTCHGCWTIWSLKKDYVPTPIKINRLKWSITCMSLYGIKRAKQFLGLAGNLNAAVPRSLIKFFDSNDVDVTKPYLHGNPQSLFSVMRENSIEYRYTLCKRVEDIVPQENCLDVQVFLLGEFDALGHSHGPNSNFLVPRILALLKTVKMLSKKSKFVVLFSDHGMFPISERIDVLTMLEGLQLKFGVDYLAFFESTMIRFWFFSDYARERITSFLSNFSFGHFLSDIERRSYGIDFKTNIYGDQVYLMEPSFEIFPSFFHPIYKNFDKGLHGYAPEAKNSYAILGSSCSLRNENGTLLDISPTVLRLLDVKPPGSWKGHSLV